jgi:magnesium chelatase family protein
MCKCISPPAKWFSTQLDCLIRRSAKVVSGSEVRFRQSDWGLPPERITVNLAPADLPKEGSQYDLPIALGLMVAMGALPAEAVKGFVAIGELSLDGRIGGVPGALPAAIAAMSWGLGLICPADCGPEAACSGLASPDNQGIVAADHILQLINHLRETQILPPPEPLIETAQIDMPGYVRCARSTSGKTDA